MKFVKLIAGVLASFLIAASASAAVIYQNGTLLGTADAKEIDPSALLSNSFTVSSLSRLTEATVGLWSFSDPTQLTWSIGRTPFASDLASGTSALSNVFVFTNQFRYNVYLSSFALDLTVGIGDYWLTLIDGSDSTGTAIFWDVNFGPSEARFRSATGEGGMDSEYFQISGDAAGDPDPDPDPGPAPVPEPASMALLAAGMIGFAASRRRARKAV